MDQVSIIDKTGTLPKIVKQYGRQKLVFDVAKMDPIMMERCADAVAEVQADDSIYVRYPMKEEGDHTEYVQDAQLADPSLSRRLNESPEDHARRIMRPSMKTAKNAFALINKLAPFFDQPQLEWEEFAKVPIHETRTFVFNILNFLDCPTASEFIPKRIVDGKQFR